MLDSSLNKLESGKYYDVTRKRDDFKYVHLKLIEVQYKEIESVLYFVNNEGRKIALYYDEILDISESRPKVKELELETGKYYDVISSSDNNEYKRLKLIEFNYTGIDSVLYFVNNEGRKISFEYCDILDIAESKEKIESKPYKYEIYFNGERLYPDFKYNIYEQFYGSISVIHRNSIIDGVTYREEGEYLRVLTNTDECNYIKIKNIKNIEHVE